MLRERPDLMQPAQFPLNLSDPDTHPATVPRYWSVRLRALAVAALRSGLVFPLKLATLFASYLRYVTLAEV